MDIGFFDFFNVSGMIPHGFCIKWTPGILWSYVISDTLITLAYYSIPATLAYFVSQRKDLKFRWIYLMFSAFILACGTTHLMSIVLIWQPLYWLDAGLKALTAIDLGSHRDFTDKTHSACPEAAKPSTVGNRDRRQESGSK